MTPEEHAIIRNKWLSIRYEYGINKVYVLKWVLSVTGIAFVIIGIILIWNKRLKREVVLRKEIETALKNSEKKYKALFNNAQVALFRNRISDGKLLEINERYANMAGYPTVDDCMTEFNAADAWVDASKREKLMEALQENGFILDYETEIIRRDTVAIWIIFSATIFPEQGYIEGSIVDISKRKKAELALRENEKKYRSLFENSNDGIILHDLNGTIFDTNIKIQEILNYNHAELNGISLKRLHPDSEIEISRHAFQQTQKSGSARFETKFIRKNGLLIDVSISSSIIDYKNGFVQGIVRDITEKKKLEAQLKQGQKMESIGTLTGGIAHDFNNIMGIVLGNTELALEDVPELNPGEHIKIMISDTGPGIDPEIIDRIFDPYFTTKEVGKGSGMGLAVVHGIVKNHNGTITVDNPGKGIRFSILFPLATEKPMVETQKLEELPTGHESILFVDDEISITKMVKRMFERLGYKVETATTPEDALKLFRLKPDHFDLVITDMTMPQMTGVKLSKKLMEIRPDIPIIVCTGHSALVDEERAKEL